MKRKYDEGLKELHAENVAIRQEGGIKGPYTFYPYLIMSKTKHFKRAILERVEITICLL